MTTRRRKPRDGSRRRLGVATRNLAFRLFLQEPERDAHVHTDEALRDGEPVERLTLLDAWEESSLYSDKERAAFAWIEEVTLIADSGASRESFEALKAHFSEDEIAWLTLAAVQINAWNRMAISSRAQYDRSMFAHEAPAAKATEPA